MKKRIKIQRTHLEFEHIYFQLTIGLTLHGTVGRIMKGITDFTTNLYGFYAADGYVFCTPDNDFFYGIEFKGDKDDYRAHLYRRAKELGLVTAIVEDANMVFSDGRVFPLSELRFKKYSNTIKLRKKDLSEFDGQYIFRD
ncbi:MAG: hypothetical protein JNL74_12010 [Fibrobacteres bacterium]|nr:hypothetical protein [Fibrobacterota bacterium]